MKYITFIFFFVSQLAVAQKTIKNEPLTSTYSIVARDPETGNLGVAVQSHWFSVGTNVSWAEAGVGAVATQSLTNPAFGQRGLELMKSGLTAEQTLEYLLENDEGRAYRQVAIIDKNGNVAAHTGDLCIAEAGHIEGSNFSVQANLMEKNTVWKAMSKAYTNADGPLAERLLESLKAAQNEGGDIRGKQSAAILVVRAETTGNLWEDRLVDLRIEDHEDPIKEMGRLLKLHRAYEHMNKGDLAIEASDPEKALKEYGAAEELFPDHLEMKFWQAVSLANIGDMEKALPLFNTIFEKDEKWREVIPRLVPNEILVVSDEDLKKIKKQ
ncbi:MAG: DUF1028 domain-containing protein [Bacteroidota bacterium]